MATEKQMKLIAKLKRIANENYERGGHWYVECFDEQDWIEFVEQEKAPVTTLRKCMKIKHERDRAMRNMGSW